MYAVYSGSVHDYIPGPGSFSLTITNLDNAGKKAIPLLLANIQNLFFSGKVFLL